MNLLDLLPPPIDDILGFLDDAPSSESSAALETSPTGRAKRRKRVQTKTVLDALRRQHAHLAVELDRLQRASALKVQGLSDVEAMWERVAMSQKALKLKAMRDNDELRGYIAEQNEYRNYLERMLLKRPRAITAIMDKLVDERWRSLTLPAESNSRVAAIHAIADRQYEMVETEMVTKGLFGPMPTDLLEVKLAPHDPRLCTAEGVRYTVLQATMTHVPDVAMEVLGRRQEILEREAAARDRHSAAIDATKHVQMLDADTMYTRELLTHPRGKVQVATSLVIKRFIAPSTGNVCIVWRSVLHDELLPPAVGSFVNDEYGWLYFEPKDAEHVHYKVFLSSSVPHVSSSVDHLSDLVQMIDLAEHAAPLPSTSDTLVDTVRSAFVRATTHFEHEIQLMAKSHIL
ncbi:hypothetical protein SPRG_05405 [Saprolegnia parasitica CBS 223.65]|uniref:Uncharacterized protein n=1 Tax=Saprolegnia parasitica (strain CBS 223.65) TaxID=695850 RepID=A0A067CRM0_SAPPC|nr:hypothetical protein SPRG_05405 [Saprolegnia parasitica CBS 223.65]KDO29161.1 hypothetical protein SPRG_05405 [Saprolegnia parasitica CBS 223.65]|eukprot:XP_012200040.1 hypothetical protein SPRG_05405 [Saprolegnia parasitica CBS 223.65]